MITQTSTGWPGQVEKAADHVRDITEGIFDALREIRDRTTQQALAVRDRDDAELVVRADRLAPGALAPRLCARQDHPR